MENEIIKFEDTRISKAITDDHLYPVFYDAITSCPFLTSDIRRSIISKWQEILPNIKEMELRVQLSRLEKSFFENSETLNREGLRNQIVQQQQYVNTMMMESPEPESKKARAISESNKVISMVSQLGDLSPSIEIRIETNAPVTLSQQMNKSNKDAQIDV